MPNIKSAKKRVLVNAKKTEQNKMIRSAVKTEIKKIDVLLKENKLEEAKAAAEKWLAAVGTAKEAEVTKAYIAELEADIMPIDGLIAFAGSEAGVGVFGAELAKNILAHAKEIKAAGAAYCDCPACAACKAILDKKAELL